MKRGDDHLGIIEVEKKSSFLFLPVCRVESFDYK